MRSWRRIFTALLLVFFGGVFPVGAVRGQAPREYDLKAVLVLNFIQFVDWSPAAFAGDDSPFVIGILGRDPFGRVLDDVVRNERSGAHRVEVRRFRSVEEVRGCQMLFVSASGRNDLPRIFALLSGKPVLTVSDFEGFALQGGMMRLLKTTEGKIQLRINLESVRTAGLAVSAKLLRVADVVNPGS